MEGQEHPCEDFTLDSEDTGQLLIVFEEESSSIQ